MYSNSYINIKIDDLKKYYEGYIRNKKNLLKIETKLFSIHRKKLDDFVLNQYLKNDGKIIDNASYSKLNISDKTICVNEKVYSYNYLIGADGVHSQLRKELTGKNQTMNFAIESSVSNNFEKIEVHFFDKLKCYGWIIPNKDNTLIGIGNVSGKTKILEDYKNYYKMLDINITDKKGAFLPTGNDILLNYNEDIYFIGDSAGLISPITGEGIYYALLSAKILSNYLNDSYNNEMKIVKKQIKKELSYKKYVYNHHIRNFLFSRYENKLINKIVNKFAKFLL